MASRSNCTSSREAFGLLDLDVGRTGTVLSTAATFAPAAHFFEIVAVELDRDVAAHTGDQFVEAQLDRLADLECAADQRLQLGFSSRSITSSLLSTPSGHWSLGFRMMKGVRNALAGIGSVADLRRPGLRIDESHFGSDADRSFDLALQGLRDWLSEVDGMRSACIAILPSSSCGMNSRPSIRNTSPASTKVPTPAPIHGQGRATALSSSGS
jgi:hypothetical protein